MDDRYYSRVTINLPSVFIVECEDGAPVEVGGVIHDISEDGLQICISKEEYATLTKAIEAGASIKFQAVDEYMVCSDTRVDIFQGTAEVKWSNDRDGEMSFGCKVNYIKPEFEEYVKNKKLAIFVNGRG